MFSLTRQCLQYTRRGIAQKFVPASTAPIEQDIEALQRFLDESQRLFVLTGAGISTESGIPDYRSEGVGLYARTDRRPMSYQDFVKSANNRRRYWARNYVGWPQFAAFQPNQSHHVIADWQRQGKVQVLVTQNVDALHSKAGSQGALVELHGCSHRVVCLHCHSSLSRWELQDMFSKLNPGFQADDVAIAPDGDVMLSEEQVAGFQVPACPHCSVGVLKPDVVFFGANVPRATVEHVFEHVNYCDAMLIAGSSLHVYSAYRFVKRARELGKPIAAVNIGATRADDFLKVRVSARCGDVIPRLRAS